VYNYLYFLIYVREKSETECDGIERYAKNRLKEGQIDFIPYIEEGNEEEEE
jgi:hypothetical protein